MQISETLGTLRPVSKLLRPCAFPLPRAHERLVGLTPALAIPDLHVSPVIAWISSSRSPLHRAPRDRFSRRSYSPVVRGTACPARYYRSSNFAPWVSRSLGTRCPGRP